MGRTASAATTVTSPTSDVFGLLTDIDRLPEWNGIVTKVVERPKSLMPGSEWVVQLKAMGSSWASRSTIEEYDPRQCVFAYRSRTDDGNPSYALWRWTVEPEAHGGSRVTVRWELHPKTFWRRALLVRIRSRQLQREVRASIESLARALRETSV
jgi:uncharacterized protein YndB with AHSA1/START domain